jgi:steroid 5-alpha reductase family enzyme
MDLYGEKAPAIPQKLVVTTLECALIALSAWIMFGGGEALVAGWLGFAPAGTIPARRWVIFAFSCIVLVRMGFMMFFLMRRSMPWQEVGTVPMAFALYYVGFALLVLPSRTPLGAVDWLGVGLFLLGSYFNTGGELERYRFKQDPANRGRLYTAGLFALSMHVNFFGDILWIAAYAVLADNLWAWLIPAFTASFFAFYNVPLLDRHLAANYGAEFDAWAARTKRLIPFVW